MKEITEILIENGQEHILEHLDFMTAQQKNTLINDLKQVDFKLLDSLFETYKKLSVSKKEKKVERRVFKRRKQDDCLRNCFCNHNFTGSIIPLSR